ncbi:MAG: fucose isomerase [Candidatus Heimdallarchaeota archaeon]|nr:fucose isomerase [Candidatus Heimdallarchaeota archaeon]
MSYLLRSSILPPAKIGILSFTDPRKDVKLVEEREQFIQKQHSLLVSALQQQGFVVVDPLQTRGKKEGIWAISTQKEALALLSQLQSEEIFALIVGCFTWNEPNVPLSLAEKLQTPVALVTSTNKDWPGITALASTGASFWENAKNVFIKKHARFLFTREADIEKMTPWLKAMRALQHVRTGKLLLWGSGPALHMEHLTDDISTLQRLNLIEEVFTEGQYQLIQKTEELLLRAPERISAFKNWLETNQVKILYDDKMLSEQTLQKQIALYLVAKDIIKTYIQNGERIIGVSIKCQPELSVQYGITPCFLPAFLPFNSDSEEPEKEIIPTVCEGDIKGLITSALLYGLNPQYPPLFGDVRFFEENYFVLGNCGAASIFYAALKENPLDNLKQISLEPQCQGVAGAAIKYHTPPTTDGVVTFARLIRIAGKHYLQVGTGKIVPGKEPKVGTWGATWPYTAIEVPVEQDLFIKALGTNHLSVTPGNFSKEFAILSQMLEIPVINLNDSKALERFLAEI